MNANDCACLYMHVCSGMWRWGEDQASKESVSARTVVVSRVLLYEAPSQPQKKGGSRKAKAEPTHTHTHTHTHSATGGRGSSSNLKCKCNKHLSGPKATGLLNLRAEGEE